MKPQIALPWQNSPLWGWGSRVTHEVRCTLSNSWIAEVWALDLLTTHLHVYGLLTRYEAYNLSVSEVKNLVDKELVTAGWYLL